MSQRNLHYAGMIGGKLRDARQQQRMSLRELAQKASISASMLSQIETGKAYPSVRSIYNIAEALALPVDHFFPEQDEPPQGNPSPTSSASAPADEASINAPSIDEASLDEASLDALTASEMREATLNRDVPFPPTPAQALHADSRPTIQLKGGVTWSRLTAAAEADAEFLEISYAPGASSGANLSHHEGREFGLVLQGELVIQLGFQHLTLREGDSIVFDSSTPHRLSNRSTEPMRALWVVWAKG